MKANALFVHRRLPIPSDFAKSLSPSFRAKFPPENVFHISASASPESLRGLQFGRVTYVDVRTGDLAPDLVDAIAAAFTAGLTTRIDGAGISVGAVKLSDWVSADNLTTAGAITASKFEMTDEVRIGGLTIKRETENLDIGAAVHHLRQGRRVAREGWNGKGMHLELQVPDAHSKMSLPYVFMFTADGHRVPWLCSQSDLLARDWRVVPEAAAEPAPSAAPKKPGPWHKPLPPELDPAQIAGKSLTVGDLTGTRVSVFADQMISPDTLEAMRSLANSECQSLAR